ncbi:hypothetical protein ABB02_00968 [Clostridiaceae bacterium JG1575]|nr:hypothetical protein ABB02_00968 [Clostridiaceae bacterium JG1575]
MKKNASLILTTVLTVGLLAGCSSAPKSTTGAGALTTPSPATQGKDSKASAPSGTMKTPVPAAPGSITKLGLASINSVKKSKAGDSEKGPTAQSDVLVAAVGFDKDGKVASIMMDSAQTKIEYNKDGSLKSDLGAAYRTKGERKDSYGMKAASGIGMEWYQQVESLCAWMQGKTLEEIKAMKTKPGKDQAHPAVPDEADLQSSVTISVQDFKLLLEKAWANAQEVTSGADKVGLGIDISVKKSAPAKDGKGPSAQIDNTLVAVALKGDVIEGARLDVVQAKVDYQVDGSLKTNVADAVKSKRDYGDAYNMKKASSIGKEWYQQADAIDRWAKGKTLPQFETLPEKVKTEADLLSSVTISVNDYMKVYAQAVQKAR